MAINLNKDINIKDAAKSVTTALQAGDNAALEKAFGDFGAASSDDAIARIQADFEEYKQTQDESILQRRGYRVLTSKENQFYENIAQVMRSDNPKQAFSDLLGNANAGDIMPTTIIEDVFAHLTDDHPLLAKISTVNVKYFTKWILNAHNAQLAAWGAITDAITKEITSDLKVVDLHQNKLSCFVILEQGYADLGPTFLDAYIRQVMSDAMAYALETAILHGDGNGQPIGMDRDLSKETNGVYAQKEAIAVTDFTPASYGELLSNFCEYEPNEGQEKGKNRTFTSVGMIISQKDYVRKVRPATQVLAATGQYVENLFPFPTEVIPSVAMDEGEAIMGIMDEYKMFAGQAARNKNIEYSDDYHFLEDERVFKVVQYADGRPYDNTSFLRLDISGLDPAYITVLTKTAAAASDVASEEDADEV